MLEEGKLERPWCRHEEWPYSSWLTVSLLAITHVAKLESKMLAGGEEFAFLHRVHLVQSSFDVMPWFALARAHCEGISAPLVRDRHRPTQVFAEVFFEARDRVL